MTETKNFQWLLVPSFESLFQGVNYEVTMSCALMANYYISWRLQNIVTSSKYINIQRSWKVRVTSCYSILMTSHYFEVSKIQSNKPLRLPHGGGFFIILCSIYCCCALLGFSNILIQNLVLYRVETQNDTKFNHKLLRRLCTLYSCQFSYVIII